MTCIIGLVEDGKLYMGSDSGAMAGWDKRLRKRSKVFKVGEFTVGYTSSFRMGQILQFHLNVRAREEGETVDEYIVRGFIEAVRKALKDYGYTKVESNREEAGEFLLGYQGHLWNVSDDLQAGENVDGFDAVGCGAPYALAAMKALDGLPPLARIEKALAISAYFSNGVSGPFEVGGDL